MLKHGISLSPNIFGGYPDLDDLFSPPKFSGHLYIHKLWRCSNLSKGIYYTKDVVTGAVGELVHKLNHGTP